MTSIHLSIYLYFSTHLSFSIFTLICLLTSISHSTLQLIFLSFTLIFLFFSLSTHLSICIHLHNFLALSTLLPIYNIHPCSSIFSSMPLSSHLSQPLSTHLSVCLSTNLFVYHYLSLSIYYLFLLPSLYPNSIYVLIYLFLPLSTHLHICIYFSPPIYQSTSFSQPVSLCSPSVISNLSLSLHDPSTYLFSISPQPSIYLSLYHIRLRIC